MRHYYRIETSAFAPTEMSVPAVTCESMNAALDKLTEIANEWRDKLNAPLMREIGGRCELIRRASSCGMRMALLFPIRGRGMRMDNNMRCFEYFQLTPEIKERLKLLEKQFLEKVFVDDLLGGIRPLPERCSEMIYEGVFLAAAEAHAGDKHPVRAWCLRQLEKGTIVSDSWKEGENG